MKTQTLGQTPQGRKFAINHIPRDNGGISHSLEWLPVNGIGSISISIQRHQGDLFHALTHGLPIRQYLNC